MLKGYCLDFNTFRINKLIDSKMGKDEDLVGDVEVQTNNEKILENDILRRQKQQKRLSKILAPQTNSQSNGLFWY